MHSIIQFIAVVSWIAGVVIAKGFWSTFFAVIIPFWSWYLVVESILIKFNLIG